METMEVPIMEGTRAVGSCQWEPDGIRVRFWCRIPGRQAVCKLWLERHGGRTLLGTPQPGEGGLILNRTLSQRELERSGSFPPERIVCTSDAPAPEPQPQFQPQGFPCGDAFLRQVFCRGGWSWHAWEQGTELWHLWPERSPFPVPALFCFCRVSRGKMGRMVIIRLDRDGMPVLWQ